MSKKINKRGIVGKTVKRLEQPGVNCLILYFTDGSQVTLETEHVGYGIYGILQVPNESLDSSNK